MRQPQRPGSTAAAGELQGSRHVLGSSSRSIGTQRGNDQAWPAVSGTRAGNLAGSIRNIALLPGWRRLAVRTLCSAQRSPSEMRGAR